MVDAAQDDVTLKAFHYLHWFICRGSCLGLEAIILFIHHFTEKFSGSLAKGQNLQVPLLGSASSNLPLTAPSLVPPFSPLHHPPVQLKAFLPMVPVVPAMLLSFSTCPSPPHIQPFSTQTLLSIPEWSPNVQNQVSRTSFGCSFTQHPNLLSSKLLLSHITANTTALL